jgi:hypothetical protein
MKEVEAFSRCVLFCTFLRAAPHGQWLEVPTRPLARRNLLADVDMRFWISSPLIQTLAKHGTTAFTPC